MGKAAMKRDIQGKFALKNDDYRSVRSIRLTDLTWSALGIAAEWNGISRADYLEQMVKDNELPSITRKGEEAPPSNTRIKGELLPSITRYEEEIERLKVEIQELSQKNALLIERATITLPVMADLEALRDKPKAWRYAYRVLFDLKLGKQAPGYKAAQKALNRFIAELTHPKTDVFWLRQQYQQWNSKPG